MQKLKADIFLHSEGKEGQKEIFSIFMFDVYCSAQKP